MRQPRIRRGGEGREGRGGRNHHRESREKSLLPAFPLQVLEVTVFHPLPCPNELLTQKHLVASVARWSECAPLAEKNNLRQRHTRMSFIVRRKFWTQCFARARSVQDAIFFQRGPLRLRMVVVGVSPCTRHISSGEGAHVAEKK